MIRERPPIDRCGSKPSMDRIPRPRCGAQIKARVIRDIAKRRELAVYFGRAHRAKTPTAELAVSEAEQTS
jgi:hypothetical protein